jgi:hypothetical protein
MTFRQFPQGLRHLGVFLLPQFRTAAERVQPQTDDTRTFLMQTELRRQPRGLSAAQGRHHGVGARPRARRPEDTERLRVVDWEHPENNDFLLVSQFSVTGALYTCRPDLVGFVNGLPWVVIELKKPGVPARAAFDENLTHYKQQIPALFWSNALLIASNGTDSRVGSLTADWERFFEWKRIEREDEPRRVSLEVMLRGTCDRPPARPGGELHAVLRAQGRAGQDHRPEPPVPRRQQRHRLDAGSAQAGPRARRRVLADAGQRQELLDGVLRAEGAAQAGRATGRSWSSPTAWSWTSRSPRPSRPPAR